jgi:Peroxin-3
MSNLLEGSQSTGPTSSVLTRTSNYLWKNRNKIAVGGAVCVAGFALYCCYSMSKSSTQAEDEKYLMSEVRRESQIQKRPGDRSRMLLRIRKQFDFAIRQFLPTMRAKILEVVDVSSAIRKIKELRAVNSDSDLGDDDNGALVMTEAMLWDEIKVSSLTLLYVSAYMVSAVTILLRIQLHILGKSMESVVGSQSSDEGEKNNFGADDDVFKILIEGTYKHIFGSGLQALSDYVRPRVAECFADWTVRDKLNVSYEELVRVLTEVHRNIERDSTSLPKMIMLRKYPPPPYHSVFEANSFFLYVSRFP